MPTLNIGYEVCHKETYNRVAKTGFSKLMNMQIKMTCEAVKEKGLKEEHLEG